MSSNIIVSSFSYPIFPLTSFLFPSLTIQPFQPGRERRTVDPRVVVVRGIGQRATYDLRARPGSERADVGGRAPTDHPQGPAGG